ncbi:MAG: hypothetical protein ABI068_08570 [Ktedonobacterales bacterium]
MSATDRLSPAEMSPEGANAFGGFGTLVVTAIQARSDWVLSTNTAQWHERLAERTRSRMATPLAFLEYLSSISS